MFYIKCTQRKKEGLHRNGELCGFEVDCLHVDFSTSTLQGVGSI